MPGPQFISIVARMHARALNLKGAGTDDKAVVPSAENLGRAFRASTSTA
jgi:hypothetical protein